MHFDAVEHKDGIVFLHAVEEGPANRSYGLQVAKLAAHQMAKLGVERPQWLVHQKGLRPPHHGAPKRDALPVAARKFRRLARQEMLDPQEARGLLHALANLAAAHALALQRKADILRDIHVRIEREKLEDESDVAGRGTAERHVLPVEQNLPLGRQLKARDHAQRGRLAAAGGPQHRKEGAVVDSEVRALHGRELIERFAQAFDADLCHGCRPIPENG